MASDVRQEEFDWGHVGYELVDVASEEHWSSLRC